MNNTIKSIAFPLEKMSRDQILNKVYLADEGNNFQLFESLQQGRKAIDQFLPNHFDKLNKCAQEVSTLLFSHEIEVFSLESDLQPDFPFLMLANAPTGSFSLCNRLNYGQEQVTIIEASMVLNTLAYCLMCERSNNENEQYFAAFMADYLKLLARHNQNNDAFNCNAFDRLID